MKKLALALAVGVLALVGCNKAHAGEIPRPLTVMEEGRLRETVLRLHPEMEGQPFRLGPIMHERRDRGIDFITYCGEVGPTGNRAIFVYFMGVAPGFFQSDLGAFAKPGDKNYEGLRVICLAHGYTAIGF